MFKKLNSNTKYFLFFIFFIFFSVFYLDNFKFFILFFIVISAIPAFVVYEKRDNKQFPLTEVQFFFLASVHLLFFLIPIDHLTDSFSWLTNSFIEKQKFIDLYNGKYKNYYLIISFGLISLFLGSVAGKFFFNYFKFFNHINKYKLEIIKDNHFVFILGFIFFIISTFLHLFNDVFNYGNLSLMCPLFSTSCLSYCLLANYKKYTSFFLLSFLFLIISLTNFNQFVPVFIILVIISNFWMIKKKIPFFLIFFMFFYYFFTQDIKIYLREITHTYKLSASQLLRNHLQIFDLSLERSLYNPALSALEKIEFFNINIKSHVTIARVTIPTIALNNIIIKNSNNELTLLKGKSYEFLTFFFIPRYLWNTKPTNSYGPLYGKVAGLTDEGNETSVNVSWIADAYWNYGNLFILPLLIKGFLISFLGKFIYYKKGNIIYLAGIPSFSLLLLPESNFSLMLAQSLNYFVLLFLILFFILFYEKKNKS